MACGWVQIIGTNPFIKRFESARRYKLLKLKIMKYIDNVKAEQKVVSFLTIGGSETRNGIKYRLRKVRREVDGTYNIKEALHMAKTAMAVIQFNEKTELGKLILASDLNICNEKPNYE